MINQKIYVMQPRFSFHQLTCYRHSVQPLTRWIVVELGTWRIQDMDSLQQFLVGNELGWSSH